MIFAIPTLVSDTVEVIAVVFSCQDPDISAKTALLTDNKSLGDSSI